MSEGGRLRNEHKVLLATAGETLFQRVAELHLYQSVLAEISERIRQLAELERQIGLAGSVGDVYAQIVKDELAIDGYAVLIDEATRVCHQLEAMLELVGRQPGLEGAS